MAGTSTEITGEFSFLSCSLLLAQLLFFTQLEGGSTHSGLSPYPSIIHQETVGVERNRPTDLPATPSDEGGPSTEIPLPKQLWLVSS